MMPSEHEPLTEAVFMILLALAGGERHGYAIMQEVETISDGRVKFSTGTLYGALKRLLERGWIERTTADTGERARKVYRLTRDGRDLLTAETRRMERLAVVAQQRLQGGEA